MRVVAPGAGVAVGVVFKLLLDLADLFNDAAGVLGQAVSVGGGLEALSGADEQFGPQLGGQVMELQADRAGGDVHLMRGEGDAGGIHHGEKELELTKIHGRSRSLSFTKYTIQLFVFDISVKASYLSLRV